MTEYEWRERTEEGTRHYWAGRFARQWKIETKLKSEETWTTLQPPFDPVVVRALRDVLWARYQRRKLPFEVVREIDSLLPAADRLTADDAQGGPTRTKPASAGRHTA